MRSSSSDGEEEDLDEMFPEPNAASNAQENPPFSNPFATLSPPMSQDLPNQHGQMEDVIEITNNVNENEFCSKVKPEAKS